MAFGTAEVQVPGVEQSQQGVAVVFLAVDRSARLRDKTQMHPATPRVLIHVGRNVWGLVSVKQAYGWKS